MHDINSATGLATWSWRQWVVFFVWLVCVLSIATAVFFGYIALAEGVFARDQGLGAGLAILIGGGFSLMAILVAAWTGSALSVWYRKIDHDPPDDVRYARFARILVWPVFAASAVWFALSVVVLFRSDDFQFGAVVVCVIVSALATLATGARLSYLHKRASRFPT